MTSRLRGDYQITPDKTVALEESYESNQAYTHATTLASELLYLATRVVPVVASKPATNVLAS